MLAKQREELRQALMVHRVAGRATGKTIFSRSLARSPSDTLQIHPCPSRRLRLRPDDDLDAGIWLPRFRILLLASLNIPRLVVESLKALRARQAQERRPSRIRGIERFDVAFGKFSRASLSLPSNTT